MKYIRSNSRQTLHINEQSDLIKEGGEGCVYCVNQAPDLVAKVYKQPTGDRRKKVEVMCRNPPNDDANPGHVSLAWPLESIVEMHSGRFAGFLMKRIEKAEPFHQVANPKSRGQVYPGFDYQYLVTSAANIATAFHAAHSAGYVVGDVNDQNVMISERALITILDTDSFQVQDGASGRVFRCRVGVPAFTAPELQKKDFSRVTRRVEQDLFGLGVLIFELLMGGVHPFSGVPDASAEDWEVGDRIREGNFPFGAQQRPLKIPPLAPTLGVLPVELRKLFLRCFEGGKSAPKKRPTAADWRKALRKAATNLKTCSKDAVHVYDNSLSTCPWCKLVTQQKKNFAQVKKNLPRSISFAKPQPAAPRYKPPPRPVAPPPPPPPRPEIVPGRWQIIPDLSQMPSDLQSLASMTGMGSAMEFVFEPNGSAQGLSRTSAMGMTIDFAMNGQWSYDLNYKVLSVNVWAEPQPVNMGFFGGGTFLPPMPPQQISLSLKITSGSAGHYQAYDTAQGSPHTIIAL